MKRHIQFPKIFTYRNKQRMMKQPLTTSGLLLLLATMNGAEPQGSVSEKSEQPLSPETEMAIMRVMNLENRIQTLQTVPAKMTDNELADHFSGTWICFTTMRLNGQLGRGIMQLNLKQEGDELTGDGGQLKHPFDPPSTIRPIGYVVQPDAVHWPIQEGDQGWHSPHGRDRETGCGQRYVGDLYGRPGR